MIELVDMEFTGRLTDLFMKGCGLMIYSMVMGKKFGPITRGTRASIIWEKNQEKVIVK